MTTAEAKAILITESIDHLLPKPFELYFGEAAFKLSPSSLGAVVDLDATVLQAKRRSWRGGLLGIWERRWTKKPTTILPGFHIDPDKTKKAILDIAATLDSPPRDAEFMPQPDKKAIILHSQRGRKVDVDATWETAIDTAIDGQFRCPIRVKFLEPKFHTEDLAPLLPIEEISTFTTIFGSHDSPNRLFNIRHIADLVQNTVVTPEGTFSLLSVIGDFDEAHGFKEAYVIIDGQLEPQYGGGTCQIATTLFNATALAGLKILSRKNHSLYFSIYPLGRDATVYPPYYDFKFRNNTGHPIVIGAHMAKKSLTFRIFGQPTGKVVTFSPPIVKYVSWTVSNEATAKEKFVHGKPFKTTVIQTTKKDGKVIETKVWKSFYKIDGDKDKDSIKIKRKEPR